jgi:hypothetical protein
VRHLCLSAQSRALAGASRIAIAARPEEARWLCFQLALADYWRGHAIALSPGWAEPIHQETRMSDKRTTPDPAEGERRRKRPAPTIDLTATEVPAADQPMLVERAGRAAATACSQAAHESEPARAASDRPKTRNSLANAACGIAGAAIMTGVLVALAIGLVPSRYAESTRADLASIAAQRSYGEGRTGSRVPGNDASVSERFLPRTMP